MGSQGDTALTLADYLALCEAAPEGVRYEAAGGRAVMMAGPSRDHQVALGRVFTTVEAGRPERLETLLAPFDWVLWQVPTLTVRQPDLMVVDRDQGGDDRLTSPPVLVVEVLSPTTRSVDLREKRAEYARAGAPHYWVVDLDTPSIEALALEDGAYRTVARAEGDQPFSVTDPFGVTVVPADLTRKGGGASWVPRATRH
jgi:Uma2 family endonuclease